MTNKVKYQYVTHNCHYWEDQIVSKFSLFFFKSFYKQIFIQFKMHYNVIISDDNWSNMLVFSNSFQQTVTVYTDKYT